MEITIQGKLEGLPVEAAWQDGELTGDPPLLAWIDGLVKSKARVRLPGIITGEASLDEPAIAAATMVSACDDGGQLGGDRLVIEQPPPGAEA